MTTGKQARSIGSGLATMQKPQVIGQTGTVSLSGINMLKSHTASIGSGYNFATANIQSIQGLSAQALSSLSVVDLSMPSSVKKYEVYESPIDILALSVALKKHRESGSTPITIHKLLDSNLFKLVSSEDHTEAAAIRDYYSKKVMMWKLKDIRLTKFREDLNTFVHNDGLTFKEEMLGLSYHLPTFYKYDLELDGVRNQVDVNQQFDKLNKDHAPMRMMLDVEVTPIQKLERKTKRGISYQYWMKDSQLNAGCLIKLQAHNPLQHIWDHIFSTTKVLQITGDFRRIKLDDFEFFSITNWNLSQT